MHILDNIIIDKLLGDISALIRQLGIDETSTPETALIRFLILSEYFTNEIFEVYTKHHKRILIILEKLATKQGLDTNRQVFNLVRNYISKTNIKLTISDLVYLYLSHKHRTVIVAPEIIKGLRLTNPD